MKKLRALRAVVLVLALAIPAPLWSQAPPKTVTCKDGTTSEPGKGACSHHGGVVSSKATVSATKKAVTCKDGTTSKPGKGACSHHGGVAPATAPPAQANQPTAIPGHPSAPPVAAKEKTPAPSTAPADATALCNDGTYSHAQHHRGACSHHGGVKQWLKEVPR
jgi:Protein of unknown function (DUF3761)